MTSRYTPSPRTAAQREALAEAREQEVSSKAAKPNGKPWAPYASKIEWSFAQYMGGFLGMDVTEFGGRLMEMDHQPARFYLIPPSDGAKGVSYRPDFRLRIGPCR